MSDTSTLSAAADHPGAVLKTAREAQGLTAAEVARQLKLSLRRVEALEAGNYAALPGGTFLRGLIRNYARLVQVDAAPMIAACNKLSPQKPAELILPRSQEIPFPAKDEGSRTRVAVLALVASLVAGATYFEWPSNDNSAPAGGAGKAGRQEKATAPAASAKPAVAAIEAAPVSAPAVISPVAAHDAPAAPAPPAPDGANNDAATRIVFVFDQDAWVEVRDREGKKIFSQLGHAGSTEVVAGAAPFALIVGNAPNVHLTYNDAPVDLKPHTKTDVARFTLE